MLSSIKKTNRSSKERLYILDTGEYRVILSSPILIPKSKYRYDGPSDILTFSYDIEIQKDLEYLYFLNLKIDGKTDASRRHKWKTISKMSILDNGSILNLPQIINDVFKKNYKDKIIQFNNDGCGKEHFDIIKYRCQDEDNANMYFDRFDVFIGLKEEQDKTSIGIKLYGLDRKDIMVIKKWATSFVKTTENKVKKDINKVLNDESDKGNNIPYLVKEHIKYFYPEDFGNWVDILVKLNEVPWMLKQYVDVYCKGVASEDFIYKGSSIKTYINSGMKDYEAAIALMLEGTK